MTSIKLSIIDLEKTARERSDHTANVNVQGLWLTVTHSRVTAIRGMVIDVYNYRYGRVNMTRDGAMIVLDGG